MIVSVPYRKGAKVTNRILGRSSTVKSSVNVTKLRKVENSIDNLAKGLPLIQARVRPEISVESLSSYDNAKATPDSD